MTELIIDAHAHFVPQGLLDELLSRPRLFPSVKVVREGGGVRFAFAGQEAKRPIPAGMSNVEARRKSLSDRGIDRQVVGGWLDIFGYGLPPDEGLEWTRFLNEHLLRATAEIDFFAPLATLPMQSGQYAAAVLGEALDRGFHGAMIGTQPKGAAGVLDEPDLDPFWQVASDRKAAVLVHPTFGARDDRLKAYNLVSAVGRVADTTIAVARLLFSGHLLRYPGVNLIVSHGGAALPMVLGRMRRSFATNPAQNADPAASFRRLYFDSIVYDVPTLRYVRELAGADHILMGSDDPFAIAEPEPVKFIEACDFVAEERNAILGGTAARLFGIGA